MKAALPKQKHCTASDRAAPSFSPLQARTCRVSWDTWIGTVPSVYCLLLQLSKVISANSPSLTLTGQEVNILDQRDFYQNFNTLRNFLPAFSAFSFFLENGRIDQLGLGFPYSNPQCLILKSNRWMLRSIFTLPYLILIYSCVL